MKRVLALAVAAGTVASAAFAASPWDGTYLFEQAIGTGSGGLKLFVNHTLKLGPDGCRVEAEGYQTNEELICKATPNGDKLDVFFVSYADGKTLNVHNVKIYEPNQKLFTLKHKGKDGAVTTEWAGYSMNKTIGAKLGNDGFKKVNM
jgi:hypothetical protein